MTKLLLTLLLAFAYITMQAQNAIVVHQTNGQKATFLFSEKPKVSFSENQLVVTTTTTSVQYPIYMLKKIDFDDEWEPTDIKTTQAGVLVRFENGQLHICGGEAGGQVSVYNLKGGKIMQQQLDSDGQTSLSLQMLGTGLYIFKAKGFAFKFRKS